MTRPSTFCYLFLACGIPALHAETFQGRVVDPSGASIAGAHVACVNRVGKVVQTVTDAAGAFQISVSDVSGVSLLITAPGFETKRIPIAPGTTVTLDIAPQSDAVTVAGSTMDVPLSQQGSSISIIPREEIQERNESQAIDLLRYLPGLSVTATGTRGAQTSLFIRGGDYNFGLVEIDGVPINGFGGYIDFAHIPTDFLDHIEVIRGAQSAIYGAYANAGVVNFVTRTPEENAALDALAEGGSHYERRVALGGSGTVRGFGLAAAASRLDDDGPVSNSDYHNKNLYLMLTRHAARQSRANC